MKQARFQFFFKISIIFAQNIYIYIYMCYFGCPCQFINCSCEKGVCSRSRLCCRQPTSEHQTQFGGNFLKTLLLHIHNSIGRRKLEALPNIQSIRQFPRHHLALIIIVMNKNESTCWRTCRTLLGGTREGKSRNLQFDVLGLWKITPYTDVFCCNFFLEINYIKS